MVNISILCPTRGRPEMARRMAESAVETAADTRGLEILFWLNEDDPKLSEYKHSPYTVLIMGKDGPTSYAWNELAKRAAGDILMLMGDDVVFETPGWDNKIRHGLIDHLIPGNKLQDVVVEGSQPGERSAWPIYGHHKVAVFSFDDGRSPLGEGHPHPAMTREVYNRLGYLACPMFRHFYVDTWLVDLAKEAGIFHYIPDMKVLHDKPWDRGAPDETKLRIATTSVHDADKATFDLAKERYFEADLEALLDRPIR